MLQVVGWIPAQACVWTNTGSNKNVFLPSSPLNVFSFFLSHHLRCDIEPEDGGKQRGQWTAGAHRQLNHEPILWQLDHPCRTSKAKADREERRQPATAPELRPRFVRTRKIQNMEQRKRSGRRLFTQDRTKTGCGWRRRCWHLPALYPPCSSWP